MLGVLLARVAPGAALPGPGWLWVCLGCTVGLTGVTLRWWAIRTLGAHFTRNLQIGTDHEVVARGPYRHLRHPSYTGAILMFAGVGIGLGYAQRIPREEALLREQLGQPYVDYSARTRRLIPGVW